jgi:hypothetical protein
LSSPCFKIPAVKPKRDRNKLNASLEHCLNLTKLLEQKSNCFMHKTSKYKFWPRHSWRG